MTGIAQDWKSQPCNQLPWLSDGMPWHSDGFLLQYHRIRGPLAAACTNRNVLNTARRRRSVELFEYSAIRNPPSRGQEGNYEQASR